VTVFPAPVVATTGSTDPAAPLVVLLHGRGSSGRDIIGLAEHLPTGPAYAAVRAPIAEGGGYAWFANRGVGRPVAQSLRAAMDWLRDWLDEVAPAGRPVVLIGFSGGAAFAGGLLLDDPPRYAGGAILYGTLPFDAGVPTTPARLAGVPVVVAQGEQDTVIPRELLDRTWTYLLGESGAPALARRDPGGHGLTSAILGTVAGWLAERLVLLGLHARPAPGPTTWSALPGEKLPARTAPARRSPGGSRRSSAATTPPPTCRSSCSAGSRRCPACQRAVRDLRPRGACVHADRSSAGAGRGVHRAGRRRVRPCPPRT
jgi:phospholipase/carboxylesterase